MATVTGMTAERMLEIEGESIVSGTVVNGVLILERRDGTQVSAGPVVGPPGPVGPVGPGGTFIPGELRLWSGTALPNPASYGTWVWADGAVYIVAQHPLAAANIAAAWRTFGGASDPGAANFRVPDMRGLVPAGLDQMPGGTRANRMTRAVAITLAGRTGEETHVITVTEMPSHTHNSNGAGTAVGSTTAPAKANSTTSSDLVTKATGGGAAHENVQPTVFVPYIVCLDG
jgi:microcystin-dependent protein